MGVVWKAVDTRLDRTVAIKVLRHQLSGDARNRERFEREARAISAPSITRTSARCTTSGATATSTSS